MAALMETVSQSAIATDWVNADVSQQAWGSPDDSAQPQVQFVGPGCPPAAGDWLTGSWHRKNLTSAQLVASVLVGAGGQVNLPRGRYDVWVRYLDNTPDHSPVEERSPTSLVVF